MMRTIYAILGYPLGWIMFLCYHPLGVKGDIWQTPSA